MLVHKLTIMIIDHDNLGPTEVKSVLENTRFANHCISPDVMNIESVDIGEWDDKHPLNNSQTMAAEFERLFTK